MKVMVLVKASPASEAGQMPGTGLLTVSLPVPNNTSLLGFQFYQQALALTWILGGLGAVAPGHGGHGVIGY